MPKRYLNGTLSQWSDPEIWYFDTIANMRGFTPPTSNVSLAFLTGAPASVGSGGMFAWNNDGADADNGTTIIKPTAVTGNGRWYRVISP